MFTKTFWKDLGERALATALEVFVATMVLSVPTGFAVSAVQAAGIAGLGAGLAAVKGGLAALKPGTISPASVVKPAGA